MQVVWDPRKAASNFRKHGVDLADAVIALEDERALTILDSERSEVRFKTLASDPTGQILMIIHAEQSEDTIRIISARKALKREQEAYFQGEQ